MAVLSTKVSALSARLYLLSDRMTMLPLKLTDPLRGIFLVMACAVMVLLPGCADFGTDLHPVVKSVLGSWRWVRSSGGFAGVTILPDSGVQIVDSFYPTDAFQRRRNTVLQYSGRFALVESPRGAVLRISDLKTLGGTPFISFDVAVRVEGDTLRLMETVYDGFNHTYVRVAPIALSLNRGGAPLSQ